jgi:NAD(P)-dependent dehydrogenase (short-subunit alcohol dehydrogenase family)
MIQAPYNNKVCIVTGGNFGIGKSVSLGFAKRGAKVIIADYFENDDTLIQIKSMGGDATFVKCDVSKDSDVKSMVKKCISTYGQLDYAFNNASMEGSTANLHDCTEENWDRTIALNLKGVWLCMKYEIQEMLKNGKGSIVKGSLLFSAFENTFSKLDSEPELKEWQIDAPVSAHKEELSISEVVKVIKKEIKPSHKHRYITVKKGQNLSQISEDYHISVNQLKKINNLKSDKISIGQKLRVDK